MKITRADIGPILTIAGIFCLAAAIDQWIDGFYIGALFGGFAALVVQGMWKR